MGVGALLLPLLLAQSQTAPTPAPPPAPPPPVADPDAISPPEVDPGILDGRRRPGFESGLPGPVSQDNPGAVRAPPPEAFPTDSATLEGWVGDRHMKREVWVSRR